MPYANNAAIDYPKPKIPLSPILSSYSTKFRKTAKQEPSILDCRQSIAVTSGRAAIALALESAGVSQYDEILIPAYHCESMVAPAYWLEATPIFYRINNDAKADLEDIRIKVTPNTKAIIVTHYFGFMQDLPPIIELCRAHGITVIEDCAHAFYGRTDNNSVGTQGDYAIASTMKFFPVLDGGILASNSHELNSIQTQPLPFSFEVKSFLNPIEVAVGYRRLGFFGKLIAAAMSIKDYFWTKSKQALGNNAPQVSTPSSSQGGQTLEDEWIRRKASAASNWTLSHSDERRIIEMRRNNYQRLHDAFHDLPGCHALYKELTAGTVPLVYPVYVEMAEVLFHKLKLLGVPIWRFGEYLNEAVDANCCENSVKLSAHVFQFPCHQELREDELEWMIETVCSVIRTHHRSET